MDFTDSTAPLWGPKPTERKPKNEKREYDGTATVVEQAMRGADLLAESHYTSWGETGLQTRHIEITDLVVTTMFKAWGERSATLQQNTPEDRSCRFCAAQPDTTYHAPYKCPLCFGSRPPPLLPRPLAASIIYLHKIILAGEITEENMGLYMIACLLMALKVQMPITVSWGVSVAILLVTGKAIEEREYYKKTREEVLLLEHKVLQIVGETGLRCVLPSDYIASNVDNVISFLRKPDHTEYQAILSDALKTTLRNRAQRLEVLCLTTPLYNTCDSRELGSAFCYLAWRSLWGRIHGKGRVCASLEEVEALDSKVLSLLTPNSKHFAEVQSHLDDLQARLASKDAARMNNIPYNTMHFLIKHSLIQHNDSLYFGGISFGISYASVTFCELFDHADYEESTLSGLDHREGAQYPLNAEGYYRFTVAKTGETFKSLRELTDAALADYERSGTAMSLPEFFRNIKKYRTLSEQELMDVWRVKRGARLFKLRALVLGWPRLLRHVALCNIINFPNKTACKMTYPNALYEVMYWLVWVSVRRRDCAFVVSLLDVPSYDVCTLYLRLIFKEFRQNDVINDSHNAPELLGRFFELFGKESVHFEVEVACPTAASWDFFEKKGGGAVVASLKDGDRVVYVHAYPTEGWACVLLDVDGVQQRAWCSYFPETDMGDIFVNVELTAGLRGCCAFTKAALNGTIQRAEPVDLTARRRKVKVKVKETEEVKEATETKETKEEKPEKVEKTTDTPKAEDNVKKTETAVRSTTTAPAPAVAAVAPPIAPPLAPPMATPQAIFEDQKKFAEASAFLSAVGVKPPQASVAMPYQEVNGGAAPTDGQALKAHFLAQLQQQRDQYQQQQQLQQQPQRLPPTFPPPPPPQRERDYDRNRNGTYQQQPPWGNFLGDLRGGGGAQHTTSERDPRDRIEQHPDTTRSQRGEQRVDWKRMTAEERALACLQSAMLPAYAK